MTIKGHKLGTPQLPHGANLAKPRNEHKSRVLNHTAATFTHLLYLKRLFSRIGVSDVAYDC